MPSSATTMSTHAGARSPSALGDTVSRTCEPGSLYLMALSTRFPTARSNCPRSACNTVWADASSGPGRTSDTSCLRACSEYCCATSPSSGTTATSSCRIEPSSSTRLSSSKSLMMWRTRSASVPIRSTSRVRTAASSSSASVSDSSAMAPTGVRSSWLRLATKSRRTSSTRTPSVRSAITATAPSAWLSLATGCAPISITCGGGPVSFTVRERACPSRADSSSWVTPAPTSAIASRADIISSASALLAHTVPSSSTSTTPTASSFIASCQRARSRSARLTVMAAVVAIDSRYVIHSSRLL